MAFALFDSMRIAPAVLCAALVHAGAHSLPGQEQPCPAARSATDSVRGTRPEVTLRGKVTAREVRFESQPQVSVQVRGCPALDTTRLSVRTNLPRPVQPGVTYRDVQVDFQLSAWIRDIDCAIGRALQARQRQNLRITAPDSLIRQMLQSCPAADSLSRR
jgi:hypothetical protein